jgi:site-specific recombinase XerD
LTKTKRTYVLPLHPEAKQILLEEWSFKFSRKKRLKALKIAWIKNFVFHDLRHTFATKLLLAGTDLMTIKELLNHSDISTTQIYLNIAEEQKRKAILKISV